MLIPAERNVDFVRYIRIAFLTYLLTYAMQQSPSWEANWFAAMILRKVIKKKPKAALIPHKNCLLNHNFYPHLVHAHLEQ
jgi:hypothetical protein